MSDKYFIKNELTKSIRKDDIFFADSGCPGQRGLNEHSNGLLRQMDYRNKWILRMFLKIIYQL